MFKLSEIFGDTVPAARMKMNVMSTEKDVLDKMWFGVDKEGKTKSSPKLFDEEVLTKLTGAPPKKDFIYNIVGEMPRSDFASRNLFGKKKTVTTQTGRKLETFSSPMPKKSTAPEKVEATVITTPVEQPKKEGFLRGLISKGAAKLEEAQEQRQVDAAMRKSVRRDILKEEGEKEKTLQEDIKKKWEEQQKKVYEKYVEDIIKRQTGWALEGRTAGLRYGGKGGKELMGNLIGTLKGTPQGLPAIPGASTDKIKEMLRVGGGREGMLMMTGGMQPRRQFSDVVRESVGGMARGKSYSDIVTESIGTRKTTGGFGKGFGLGSSQVPMYYSELGQGPPTQQPTSQFSSVKEEESELRSAMIPPMQPRTDYYTGPADVPTGGTAVGSGVTVTPSGRSINWGDYQKLPDGSWKNMRTGKIIMAPRGRYRPRQIKYQQ